MSNIKNLEKLNDNDNNNNTDYNFIKILDFNSEIKKEEKAIKKLIEEINKVEEKINIINNSSSKKEPKFQKLSELESKKDILQKNITQNNNSLSIEIKKNDIFLEHKKILINELDKKINDNKNKLNSFNAVNFKSLQLIKYIFCNETKEGFLTKEQINNILNNKNNNNLSNEEELKKIMKEKEINKASEKVIENNLLNIKLKKEQIEENLRMLEEEKDSTYDELEDIISSKESIDYIIKIIITKLIKNKYGEINEIDDEELNKPIDILLNELLYIDPIQTANRITDNIYEIYELDKKHNKINYNTSYICDSKTSKNRNRSGSYDSEALSSNNNKENNNYLENNNNPKTHKRSESNDITKQLDINIKENIINNNTSVNINTIKIKKPENSSLDKKVLTRLIQNEIETFLNTRNIQNNNDINLSLLNDFLYNLSMIIINKIKSIIEKEKEKNKIFHQMI